MVAERKKVNEKPAKTNCPEFGFGLGSILWATVLEYINGKSCTNSTKSNEIKRRREKKTKKKSGKKKEAKEAEEERKIYWEKVHLPSHVRVCSRMLRD